MKLIYCNKCGDVVALRVLKPRTCECGESGGQYLNNLDAEYWGDCVPLGFNNYDLAYKLDAQPKLPAYGYGDRFEAFTIPSKCKTFIRVEKYELVRE